jgi:NAD-dependent SIR2 family protein deacetylase
MTEWTLLALRLTCPECHAEYDDATAEVEARPAYAIFRCPHCQEGQIALAVLKSRSQWPDPLPMEHSETLLGERTWDGIFRWPWKRRRRS